ncbi:MAG: hypothetical protein IJ837_01620 [Clostridia bacterium]|nr:hypothetical protein [Clostridia bacterium]
MEDKKLNTRENLNKFGIFQLREYARSIGVHLPTTYKKDDLIEKIMQVENGTIEPFVPKNKKGRPPKNVYDFNADWNVGYFEYADQTEEKTSWVKGSFIQAQEPRENLFLNAKVSSKRELFITKDGQRPKEDSGILKIEPNGCGTLHLGGLNSLTNDDIAIIPYRMVKTYSLLDGDKVDCLCYDDGSNYKQIADILKINDCILGGLKRLYVSENRVDIIASSDVIKFWEDEDLAFSKFLAPIGKGQRVLVHADKNSNKSDFLNKLAIQTKNQNLHTIVVAIDKRPEEKSIYNQENIEYAFSTFDMTPFRQMYLVNLSIERAKRLCEMGQDVVLIIDDLISVLRAYNYSTISEQEEKVGEFNLNAIVAVKKLLAVAKNVEQAGTITLIAGVLNEQDSELEKIVSRFDSLCNSHIYLSEELYSLKAKSEVLPKSYTDNSYQLIDKLEIEKAEKLRQLTKDKTIKQIAEIYEKML